MPCLFLCNTYARAVVQINIKIALDLVASPEFVVLGLRNVV